VKKKIERRYRRWRFRRWEKRYLAGSVWSVASQAACRC
jgi:hypothetical protein